MKDNVTFRQHAVRGLSWLAIIRLAEKAVSFLRTIILARILTPADFGIFGVALLTLSFAETFSDPGIHEALIQKPGKIESDLPTAWPLLALRGILLSIVILLIGNWVAQFFHLTQPSFITIIALVPLFRGLSNPATILWRKSLNFRADILYGFSSSFFEAGIAIILALKTHSVWSLPLAMISATIIQMTISLFAVPIYHSLVSFNVAKSLIKFGRWINLNSIISFLSHQGDDIVVGKMLGAHQLGLYQTAYRFSLLPATQVSSAVSLIGFPLLSAEKTNFDRLRRTLKLSWSVAYPSFLIGGMILVFAPELVSLILGSVWSPMVPTLRLLIIYGMIRSLGSIWSLYFSSSGAPQWVTLVTSVKFLIILLLIFPAIRFWGINGAAGIVVIASVIANSIQIKVLSRQKGFDLSHHRYPVITLIIAGLLSFLLKSLLPQTLFYTGISLAVFLVLFVALAIFLDRLLVDLLIQEIKPRLPRSITSCLFR